MADGENIFRFLLGGELRVCGKMKGSGQEYGYDTNSQQGRVQLSSAYLWTASINEHEGRKTWA